MRYVRYLLEHDARAAAERFPDAVDKALRQLLDMPGMGALQAFTHPQLGAMRAWLEEVPLTMMAPSVRECIASEKAAHKRRQSLRAIAQEQMRVIGQ